MLSQITYNVNDNNVDCTVYLPLLIYRLFIADLSPTFGHSLLITSYLLKEKAANGAIAAFENFKSNPTQIFLELPKCVV